MKKPKKKAETNKRSTPKRTLTGPVSPRETLKSQTTGVGSTTDADGDEVGGAESHEGGPGIP